MLNKILPNPFPGEKPVFLIRRHWFILTKAIIRSIAFLLVPALILGVFGVAGIRLDTNFGDPLFGVIVIAILLYCGVVLLSLFTTWLDYSLDIWLVTTHRIISVEQQGLFTRTLSEQRLDRVQDVTSDVRGFMQTMVGYGNVFIQSASERERITLKQVPNPTDIARRVITLQNEALNRLGEDSQGIIHTTRPIPMPQQTKDAKKA